MTTHITRQWVLPATLLLAASFYRPLTFWASNAWELTSIPKLIGFGLVTFAISLLVFILVVWLSPRPIPVAVLIAATVTIVLNWRRFAPGTQSLVLPGALAFSLATVLLSDNMRRLLVGFLVLILGVAPLIQVALGHIQNSDPIPIVDLSPRVHAEPSGMVEDVLVVVVDSYPSGVIADTWYQHDMEHFHMSLQSSGYKTPTIAWSQHTFTSFAIPALLEMKPIVDPGVEASGLHLGELADFIGGANLFAHTLKSAGFRYTHIESGWESGNCGYVDVCIKAPFLDEMMVNLLGPSLFAQPLNESGGGWGHRGTLNTHAQLLGLDHLFGDGKRDYVFAHILLPHPPVSVDGQCDLLPMSERTTDLQGADMTPEQFSGQLSCTDRIIEDIAALADEDTAVIITADHGTKSTFDVNSPSAEWSQANIAEAFSVFLAYKIPEGCASPARQVNTAVMRAIVSCATDYEPPPSSDALLVGFKNYRWVESEELSVIEQLLSEGAFPPPN